MSDQEDGDFADCAGNMFEMPENFLPPPPQPSQASHTKLNGETMELRLVAQHSLWAHCLWNASRAAADFFESDDGVRCKGKRILELGAGASLPSIVCAQMGAKCVISTDYPDAPIIENISINADNLIKDAEQRKRFHAQGYIWGKDVSALLQIGREEGDETGLFDVMILSDLVFNHSQHGALLETCKKCLKPDGIVYVSFTHHRPHKAKEDMNFVAMASWPEYGFVVERMADRKFDVMFEKDPGDVEVRRTVQFYKYTLPTAAASS